MVAESRKVMPLRIISASLMIVSESELRDRLDRLNQAMSDDDLKLTKSLLQESVVGYQQEAAIA